MALDGPWTITHVFTMPLPGAHAGVLQLEPQLSMCLSQKPRLWMATRPVYGRKIGSSISPSIGSCPTFPPSPPPPQPPSQTPVACTRTGSITAFISAPLESIQDELEESESSGFLQVPHTGLECEGQLRSPQRHRGSHIKRQRGYLQKIRETLRFAAMPNLKLEITILEMYVIPTPYRSPTDMDDVMACLLNRSISQARFNRAPPSLVASTPLDLSLGPHTRPPTDTPVGDEPLNDDIPTTLPLPNERLTDPIAWPVPRSQSTHLSAAHARTSLKDENLVKPTDSASSTRAFRHLPMPA
ncbi:hypothetical protein D9756_010800 [Leucocoprinus leucothites]|uniref:Uncharacterized protein n=1 Tax=Leucocoprinus leucothites TaxID=201217 RepID=A0A8H5CS56_9AGAR|nr:hypothetical protein D9756_010800 [Leucoagaricus leucothites]